MKKTTEKHLAVVEREVRKWVKVFGLTEWELNFIRDDIPGWRGCLRANSEAKAAVFVLCEEWTDPSLSLNTQELRKTARHEFLELMLADFNWMATCRYVVPEEIETARHVVIQRWNNYLEREG